MMVFSCWHRFTVISQQRGNSYMFYIRIRLANTLSLDLCGTRNTHKTHRCKNRPSQFSRADHAQTHTDVKSLCLAADVLNYNKKCLAIHLSWTQTHLQTKDVWNAIVVYCLQKNCVNITLYCLKKYVKRFISCIEACTVVHCKKPVKKNRNIP